MKVYFYALYARGLQPPIFIQIIIQKRLEIVRTGIGQHSIYSPELIPCLGEQVEYFSPAGNVCFHIDKTTKSSSQAISLLCRDVFAVPYFLNSETRSSPAVSLKSATATLAPAAVASDFPLVTSLESLFERRTTGTNAQAQQELYGYEPWASTVAAFPMPLAPPVIMTVFPCSLDSSSSVTSSKRAMVDNRRTSTTFSVK